MVETVEKIGDELNRAGSKLKEPFLAAMAETIFGRLWNDLIVRTNRGGKTADILRITDKRLRSAKELSELMPNDRLLFDAFVKSHSAGDFLTLTVDNMPAWKNPENVKWLENEAYRAVIEKYRKE